MYGFDFGAIRLSVEKDRFGVITTWFNGWLIVPFFHDWVGFTCPLSVAGKRLPVSVVVM